MASDYPAAATAAGAGAGAAPVPEPEPLEHYGMSVYPPGAAGNSAKGTAARPFYVEIDYGSRSRTANELKARVACLSCDLSNAVSQTSLIFPLQTAPAPAPALAAAADGKAGDCGPDAAAAVVSGVDPRVQSRNALLSRLIRVWLDGKARPTYPLIVTPTRHVDAFAQLSDAELWGLFAAAAVVSDGSFAAPDTDAHADADAAAAGAGAGAGAAADAKSPANSPAAVAAAGAAAAARDDSESSRAVEGFGTSPLAYRIWRVNQGNYRNLAHLHLKVLCDPDAFNHHCSRWPKSAAVPLPVAAAADRHRYDAPPPVAVAAAAAATATATGAAVATVAAAAVAVAGARATEGAAAASVAVAAVTAVTGGLAERWHALRGFASNEAIVRDLIGSAKL